MQHRDEGVVLARWDHALGSDAVATTTAAVAGFATRHGMATCQREATGSAIAAVLEHAAAGRRSREHAVTIDAATDGRWLSIMLRGTALRSADENGAHAAVTAVCDRIEWPDDDRPNDRLLLEILMARASRPTV